MEVTILDYPVNGEETLAKCGMATTTSSPPTEYDIEQKEIEKFIETGRSMELSSVFDFPQIIYQVKDVSRSFTHQHVRHRMAAHMQQSMRYVEIDPSLEKEPFFVIPPSIIEKGKQSVLGYIKSQINSAKQYKSLINKELPSEDARFSLPIGTKTFLSTAMNVESLLHYFNVRSCYDSQWEIRTNSYALIAGCKLIYPNIFNKCGPHCIRGKCKGRGNGKCREKAINLLKDIEKRVNKKRNKFNRLKPGEKIKFDLTDLLGYQADPELEKEIAHELDIEKINLDRKVNLEIKKPEN
ncbi:MAG: Thymidylate synthase THY1 [Candidatus Methanohalarchaeum thermophilum]|uniref:FAD-dependent thymidylate synthase n=1 Tax=Methanohalarchaeum thermophilum TaxID=1903181 RepID=A0A1Q6DVA3_METT1|nr:MAG: Thymidylate synthase THY1 [Candidatus Methanohalarchaeum thermophilum]